ncbi:MAG: cytochrome c [Saprospiraceae bacterium]|nr:cytochrome c [Saprospiraceae bacterium]MCB0626040.1 cytochrome c [Saprospiraceae bacterium]MCB0679263.1 cytochrome c [Saprospiraceae bacterium]MCB0684303.1 cytochrome c [Saprospiraceae bacterium]
MKIHPTVWLAPLVALMFQCQSNPYQQGEILYANFCANCHGVDGQGLQGLIPPLAAADYLQEKRERLACIIRYGLQDTIEVNGRTYGQVMTGIPELSETEIANIINYIHHAWGNDFGYVPFDEVRRSLTGCEKNGR